MKKDLIDGYEVFRENKDIKKIIFKDFDNDLISMNIEKSLKIEFEQRRKETYSEEHKNRKHIDKYVNDNNLLELKSSEKVVSPEEIVIAEEGENIIIREIWKLPTPQNRRVFMNKVNEFSLTKISKIENCSVVAIKQSIDIGLENLRKKIKKFYN